MKHNSAKYRRRTRNTKRRPSKRRSRISKRRSRISKRRSRISKRRSRISKRRSRISKRRSSKRRSTRKYRLRGGEKTSAAMPPQNNPTPAGSPQETSQATIDASKNQNQQVKTMSGGSKRSRVKYNQRGGVPAPVDCVAGCNPDVTGYGCQAPSGCMAVPVVNNPDAQNLAKISANVGATAVANAEYDTRVNV